MANFSIKYNYLKDGIVMYKTAIVRASSIDAAHDKLVRFLTRSGEIVIDDFKIVKTSLSSYNLVLS